MSRQLQHELSLWLLLLQGLLLPLQRTPAREQGQAQDQDQAKAKAPFLV